MFTCWMFYLYVYITRVEPGVLADDLMNEFSMTASVLGTAMSMLYIPYVTMQIPCGVITDKLGVKTVVVISSFLCAIGTFIFGAATTVFQLEVARFLIGLSSAAAFLCCGKVALEYFEERKYAMLTGITMGIGCLGGISGTAPTVFLANKLGWRNEMYVTGAFGILTAIMAIIFLKKKDTKAATKSTDSHFLAGLFAIASKPKAWILGFYGAISYLTLSVIAELWGVPFMEQRYGISTAQASLTSLIIFIGYGVGSFLSALIAEKINSYKRVIIIFSMGLIISFWYAIYSDTIGFAWNMFALFMGGFFAGAGILCFTLAYNMVPENFDGTSSGFMNALIMSSAILFQPLLGELLDFFRNGMVTDGGEPIYTIGMYRSAFLFVILAMVLSGISTFFIDDKRCSKTS
ncbi:MAG: MFS transporter [Holosporales bacterium]|nr:MFS transporter [Holosporales bacterium]